MKLGRKILAVCVGAAMILAILGGITFIFTSAIKQDLSEVGAGNMGEIKGATRLIDNLHAIHSNLKRLLLFAGMENPGEIRLTKEKIYGAFSELEMGLSEMKAATDIGFELAEESLKNDERQELKNLNKLQKMVESYLSLVRRMIGRIERIERIETNGTRTAGRYFLEEAEPFSREIIVFVEHLRQDALEEMVGEIEEMDSIMGKLEKYILVWVIASMVAAMGVGWGVARSIARPIKKLKDAFAAVSAGMLDTRIEDAPSRDEIAELSAPFNKMTRDLKNSMTSIIHLNKEIARREKAESGLRESEKRFQEVLEHSRDILFKRNIKTGKYDYFSNSVTRLLGCSRAEACALEFKDLETRLHPEDQPKYRAFFETLIASDPEDGTDHIIEYRLKDAEGRYRWFSDSHAFVRDSEGRPTFVIGANRDITDQKKAEIALKEAHEIMLTVLDSMDAHVYVVDMESHEILLANRKLRDLLGRDLVGEPCWRAMRNNVKPCDGCITPELLDADGNPAGSKVWEDRNSVTGKWYLKHTKAVKWTDGRFVRLQIGADITRLKQMEEERRQAEERLRHSYKLEAIGAMAAGVAHNFNNLLMAVMGNLDLALEDLPDDSPVKRNIRGAESSAIRAAELSSLMLTYLGQGKASMETLDMSETLKGMADKLYASISEKSKLTFNFSSEPTVFRGDPEQVRQVVVSLTANANEAMEETGGEITLSTGIASHDSDYFKEQVMKEELPAGRYVYFEATDAGPGMDEETIGKVLDPFFTTKFIGRGLGMAAVAGIMRTHRGRHLPAKRARERRRLQDSVSGPGESDLDDRKSRPRPVR